MAGRLTGKRALITAAAQGIGRATAVAMAREGALVLATDVNATLLADLQAEAGVSTDRLDVTDGAEIAEARQGAERIRCPGQRCRLRPPWIDFGVSLKRITIFP